MYAVGDVIEDSYGNPAVVLRLDPRDGKPCTIMQLCGSDEGNITYSPRILRHIEGEAKERALEIAREVWRKRGFKRSSFGIK